MFPLTITPLQVYHRRMTEAKCAIFIDVLSTKKTVVFSRCRHENCFLCVEALVYHRSSEEPDPPYIIMRPICIEEYVVWSAITKIVHDVINLMYDPIDLTDEVIDMTQDTK